MDDWGLSVWDTPTDTPDSQPSQSTSILPPPPSEPNPASDDFDDFGEPEDPASTTQDDFGDDFGDFDDGVQMQTDIGAFEEEDIGDGFQDTFAAAIPPPRATWEPLRLDRLPPPKELTGMVEDILDDVWPLLDAGEVMTGEGIREVEGLNQVLVTSESRELYQALFSIPPSQISRPPNWTRSRIRRQHLISLGIPINLDEVLPHNNGKPLPMLNVTTRPSSAPPGPRSSQVPVNPPSGSNTRAGTPRSGTPVSGGRPSQNAPGLGPKPQLNEAKVEEMLNLSHDTLSLLPLSRLEGHLKTLKSLTNDTSALLAYLLQVRDSLQQDSETYNGLIAELVSEAQKLKSGSKTRTGVGKRGSTL
ncbi:hypothetical protein M422DRAFT_211579 [Sphaerobolus stellatus SS14]|uniref:Uncharacterized protein n=1 Tax=Sphaerobolus stellatus (strain SS14) TaxID=990650 RepID=A0A0C9URN9_SPHS4|nr:hypothetical protein M422DRAFT_211579 [Sphaerobolus stellatus SS14]